MTESAIGRTQLGNTGEEISRLGFGTHHLEEKAGDSAGIKLLIHAFDSGITIFDAANSYLGAELLLARALGKHMKSGDVFIATKGGQPGSEYEARDARTQLRQDSFSTRLKRQVEESLEVLGVDAIDLYQLHLYYPKIDPTEIVEVMNELIDRGKIRHWGISNYNRPEQVREIIKASKEAGAVGPVALQDFYTLVNRQLEPAVQTAHAAGLSVLAFSPLQQGALTQGTIEKIPAARRHLATLTEGSPEHDHWKMQIAIREQLALLEEYAADHGHNLQRFALAWLMSRPSTVPIIGAYRQEDFDDLIQAAEWTLDAEAYVLADQVTATLHAME